MFPEMAMTSLSLAVPSAPVLADPLRPDTVPAKIGDRCILGHRPILLPASLTSIPSSTFPPPGDKIGIMYTRIVQRGSTNHHLPSYR